MSSQPNFSLLNGAGVGANDNSKALGFVVLINRPSLWRPPVYKMNTTFGESQLA